MTGKLSLKNKSIELLPLEFKGQKTFKINANMPVFFMTVAEQWFQENFLPRKESTIVLTL